MSDNRLIPDVRLNAYEPGEEVYYLHRGEVKNDKISCTKILEYNNGSNKIIYKFKPFGPDSSYRKIHSSKVGKTKEELKEKLFN